MRIVHYLQRIDLEEGGVVRAVLDMGALQAGGSREVTLLTHDAPDAPEAWKAGEPGTPMLEITPAPERPLGLFSKAQLRVLEPIIKNADVLHLHACWTNANNQLARMALRLGVPYVLSMHGMLDDWCMAQKAPKKKLYLALTGRRTLEEAAFVHSTAEAELSQSKKWFPKGRGRIVPLVFDLEPYANLPGPALADNHFGANGTGDIDSDKPVVLFLSRVHPKKGLEHLIGATALLKERGSPCRTLIAGTGDDEYLDRMRALASERGVGDDVRFLGMVTGELKTSLYERANVFALPTSQENWGFVLTEALACRTPLVTTKAVDIWPELEESGGSLLAEQSEGAFADAIKTLLDDDARRESMGASGRQWILDTLDPAAVADRYEQMYADAIAMAKENAR